MARVTFWWLLVIVVVVSSGFLRLQVRQAYITENESTYLIENAHRVLLEHNYEVSEEIRDPNPDGRLIGLRFGDDICASDMAVIVFSIVVVAKSFSDDYTSDKDTHRYYYYDYSYADSARTAITFIWAKHLLKNAFTFNGQTSMREQVVVIWPKGCPEPSVDWSKVWIRQGNLSRDVISWR